MQLSQIVFAEFNSPPQAIKSKMMRPDATFEHYPVGLQALQANITNLEGTNQRHCSRRYDLGSQVFLISKVIIMSD